MNIKKLLINSVILIFASAGFLLTSCRLNSTLTDQISSRELIFPQHTNYYALVNVKDNITALILGNGTANLSAYAKEGSQDFVKFTLPYDSSCFRTVYDSYETLSDGQLQIWKRCESGGNGTSMYLMAYDLKTSQLKELAGPLPLGSSGASWNSEQTKAIGYLDSGYSSKTLFWIWNSGFGPLDLVISDKSRSWNLKDDFPDFGSGDTGKTGSTGRAMWSQDGNQIAFFASPDAVSKTGFDRFSAKYNLYLMDPKTLTLTVILDNISSPYVLAWSSDSRNIAFVGEYGFRKEYGLWIYSLDTNKITQVSKGIYKSIVWRSDESVLAAIECEDNDVCSKVIEYDLTNILENKK